jgi:hypothetical protein
VIWVDRFTFGCAPAYGSTVLGFGPDLLFGGLKPTASDPFSFS